MKYSINTWDYHGHHVEDEFESDDKKEAVQRFNKRAMHAYGDCTLYECPNGWRTSCQTISEAGYVEIMGE